jgi:hypothetical protein
MMRLQGALVAASVLFAQTAALGPDDLATRERELTSFLQAHLETHQGEPDVGSSHSFLSKTVAEDSAHAVATTTTAQALDIPANLDAIPPVFWTDAAKMINAAGLSTPIPEAASINAPPKLAPPTPWQAVMQEGAQPIDTRLGSAVMYKLSGTPPPTPPPNQGAVGQQFVAQCPMMLFEKNLSIRHASCGQKLGQWIDPNPLNPRTVLRWHPLPAGGIYFGVDSRMTGNGSAFFADIKQQLTLWGYHFVLRNCLGTERWRVEENVYKVDSMGKTSSTLELHDITSNSEAFFLKYLIKAPTGVIVAESNLFRMLTNQVNFTEYKNGINTGKLLAVATRQGQWTQTGWEACMSPTSPRGWDMYFPDDTKGHETVATVQDIRVAFSAAITLMANRDERRGKDGLNTQGSTRMEFIFMGGFALICVLGVICVNFCMVFKASGLKEKLKRTLFESEGALLPSHPTQHRAAPLHATY